MKTSFAGIRKMLGLPSYFIDPVDYSDLSQIILYEDNGLEVLYKDKSLLQISPCGANFKYTRPPRSDIGNMPALGREVTQRCVFSTSETRSKVIQAILIRNQISSFPYLPQDLLGSQQCVEMLELYENISYAEWPTGSESSHVSDDAAKANGTLCTDANGVTIVTSKKGHAKLTLFPDHHRVQVTFLAKTSTSVDETRRPHDTTVRNSKCKQTYVWQNMIFPASMCPAEWVHVLGLAKQSAESRKSAYHEGGRTSSMPRTSPITCCKQFTHEWRDALVCDHNDSGGNETGNISLPLNFEKSVRQCDIRMLWSDHTTYWIKSRNEPNVGIEVWLHNGQVLKSHSSSERSYTLLYQTHSGTTNGVFQERAIMASALPQQDVKLKSAILRAMRLQMYCRAAIPTVASARKMPCWYRTVSSSEIARYDSNHDSTTKSHSEQRREAVYEKVLIDNVGMFSAVDDSIQITFSDGTLIHMTVDTSCLVGKKIFDFSALSKDQCRLLFADGRCIVLSDLINTFTEATPYANHAIKWLEWLMKPAHVRKNEPFHSDTIHAPENANMVSHEIEKNRRFSHLLSVNPALTGKGISWSNSSLDKADSDSGQQRLQCVSYRDVCDAMSKTSRAIDDIDMVIKSLK